MNPGPKSLRSTPTRVGTTSAETITQTGVTAHTHASGDDAPSPPARLSAADALAAASFALRAAISRYRSAVAFADVNGEELD